MFERRTNPSPLRIPLQIPVRVTLSAEEFSDFVLNISTGGMFIHTNNYISPGSRIELEFYLSPHDPIHATGTVVWATEGVHGNQASYARGLGVQFTDLPPAARRQIARLEAAYRDFP